MTPVSIRSVSKSYDGRTPVLVDAKLEIAAGEMFFLLGASGCGKTTLLRVIAGFLAPDKGTVAFASKDVTSLPAEQRDIGMVFQNYALWPHLDVAGNIGFGLEMRGVPAPERIKRVDEALALVELAGFNQRRIGELSGGQQQRVALARAIVVRPRVLLLDEPLSNLDARLRVAMRGEIRRVCKAAGVTAIYVTHDQGEALSTADRIALIHQGRVAQVGTPRELYDRPVDRTVAEFVGEANLLPGQLVDGGSVQCALGRLATSAVAKGLTPGRPVLVCLRPERIRIAVDGSGDAATAGNAFDAEVRDGTFLGPTGSWRAACGATTLAIDESAPPRRAAGDRLRLRVDPADVVVLPP